MNKYLHYIIKNHKHHYATIMFGVIGLYFFLTSAGNKTMFFVGVGFLIFSIFKGFEGHEQVKLEKVKNERKV